MRYDIAVIGNDEAAFELLCAAGASGQRAVGILPERCHSAWMVSQSLRRLVSQMLGDLSDVRRRLLASSGTPRLLYRLIASAMTAEVVEHIRILENLGVDVITGECRLLNRSTLAVTSGVDCRQISVRASNLVIGVGVRRTAMHRPLGLLPFLRPESLLSGVRLPRTLCLLGGDSFGAGIAALFSLFGVPTRLLARENQSCALLEMAYAAGVTVGFHPDDPGFRDDNPFTAAHTDIVDCRRIAGFTEHLGLQAIGVEPDEHGLLWCARNLETWCTGVFGIGEVVGFSSEISEHPAEQAQRILNRITHRIPRPHSLRRRPVASDDPVSVRSKTPAGN